MALNTKYVPYNGRNIVHSLGTLHYRFNNSVCGCVWVRACVRACVRAHGSARLALFVTSPEQTNTPVRK